MTRLNNSFTLNTCTTSSKSKKINWKRI